MLKRVDLPDNAKVQEALLLALGVFLCDVHLDLGLLHSRLGRNIFKELFVLSQLSFTEGIVGNKLLLHVNVPHYVGAVIFVFVDLALQVANFLLLFGLKFAFVGTRLESVELFLDFHHVESVGVKEFFFVLLKDLVEGLVQVH